MKKNYEFHVIIFYLNYSNKFLNKGKYYKGNCPP